MKSSTLLFLVVLVVAAVIFGPKLIAKLAAMLGSLIPNFSSGNSVPSLFGTPGAVQLPDGGWAYAGKDAEDRTYDPSYYTLPLYSPGGYAPITAAIDQWFANSPVDTSQATWGSDWRTVN